MSPLKENIDSDVEEFLQLNGKKILAQTTNITDYQETLDLVTSLNSKFPNIVDFALGLHPSTFEEGISKNNLEKLSVFQYGQKQYKLFKEYLVRNINNITAIGECGLDYFTMNQYPNFNQGRKEELREIQRRIFRKICQNALEYDLPMSIHSRGEEGSKKCNIDTLTIVATEGKGILKGCFHSFTGSLDILEKVLNLGMYISFNAIITYPSGENVREILRNTPLDRILFETDGPFLPTQSVRKNKKLTKRYGRPSLIQEITEKASEIKNISYQKMEEITDNNYFNLFSK
ncbi:TatD family hydrolase [Candidatus Dojkabacteria bacterium]|uniref:TatD family hydrolase n=1 Tax=Candidatus Dojkabacteria bacterium TaxID=2099670 RepID=A0A847VEI0_9BACT|nr:TatD family hydrolase [Candidatus Dojkabacteria bacterium]